MAFIAEHRADMHESHDRLSLVCSVVVRNCIYIRTQESTRPSLMCGSADSRIRLARENYGQPHGVDDVCGRQSDGTPNCGVAAMLQRC